MIIKYDDEEERKKFLTKNKNQLERIEWLVTSLLKISRLDSGSEVLKLKETSISDVIKKSLEPLKIPMELKSISYNVDCPSDIKANIDINWTSEALINIIKNAYEHTNEKGSISISVTNNPIYVELRISDTGCGISKDDIGHVFERFYRGKSTNKESIGIGLNMAKKIIELEHGDIVVESKIDVGTTFIIKFYKSII
ncbi:MAG TPA: HAMP domain-containing sensor histidine kinase [Bacilli bacterium]|nr:HAMP domain-containing sensor histidine kinase [Bacilli bacterium]